MSLHVLFFLLLSLTAPLKLPAAERELEVSVGGPFAAVPTPPLPKVVEPDPPAAPPIVIADAAPARPPAAGSPDVTVPAQAVADAHAFPTLPAAVGTGADVAVRMLLSISEFGTVTDAQVEASSGSLSLDDLAIAWVKAHWRYRPAMRNGQPLSVQTVAIVLFRRADG